MNEQLKLCKDCIHSVPTEEALFNPKYERGFYSWESRYACLKFATKSIDVISGESYYDGITSCKDNRASCILFSSRCGPAGNYYEKKGS